MYVFVTWRERERETKSALGPASNYARFSRAHISLGIRTGICRLKFQSEMAGHLLGTIILFMVFKIYDTMYHIFLICFHFILMLF